MEGAANWIDPAQDRDKWRAVVKAARNFCGSIKCEKFIDWLRIC
jgi:hypothetical protein